MRDFSSLNLYILNGHEPVPVADVLAWAEWRGENDSTVKRDYGPDWELSTVFLGVDHNIFGEHPQVFETALFGRLPDGQRNGVQVRARYATWAEAEAGHELELAKVRRQNP